MAYQALSEHKYPFSRSVGRARKECALEATGLSNRKTAQEAAEEATAYDANNLNQYTAIQEGTAEAFVPTFDADGKAPDGCKGDWTNAQHLPEGRGAVGRLRVTLGRPTNRSTARQGSVKNDTFTHNVRSESARRPRLGRLRQQAVRAIGQTRSVCPEGARSREAAPSQLAAATLGTDAYSYSEDKAPDGCKGDWTNAQHLPRRGEGAMGCARVNIGNRKTAQEAAEEATAYDANNLNQYTAIQTGEEAAFVPTFDADGNQTKVKTSTGIWNVVYNAENRPVTFTSEDGATVVECTYDYMGRRHTRKITVNGSVTNYLRYIYRGYLQIAAINAVSGVFQWFILWDPTQPVATRPLGIRKDGTWYTYGWDLTKNTCELYSTGGTVSSTYTYSPFGKLMVTGSLTQPIQWSGEMWDAEVGMVYYNYRYYNPGNGRWLNRDFISRVDELNPYLIVKNNIVYHHDFLGLTRDCSSAEKKEMREDFEYALKIIKTNSDVAKKKIEGYLSWSNITIVKVIERDKKLREYECTKCREKWYTRILPWSCEKYTDLTIKTILKVAYIEGFELNREEANKILTQIDLPSIPDILSKLGINIASQYKIKDFRFKVTYNKICTAKELELYC